MKHTMPTGRGEEEGSWGGVGTATALAMADGKAVRQSCILQTAAVGSASSSLWQDAREG